MDPGEAWPSDPREPGGWISFREIGWLAQGWPGGSEVKSPPADAGDLGLIPEWGRSPGGGQGNPLQCSCLENPMDRGAWWAAVHGVTKGQTQLSTQARP